MIPKMLFMWNNALKNINEQTPSIPEEMIKIKVISTKSFRSICFAATAIPTPIKYAKAITLEVDDTIRYF